MEKENKCNIVLDMLPLYVDGVCSQESKRYVEEHLKECKDCEKEYEEMKENLVVPVDEDITMIKKIKKQNRMEKGIIAMAVAVTFAIVCFVFIEFALAPKTNVNKDVKNQVSIELDSEGVWWLSRKGNAIDVSRIGVRVYKEDGTLMIDTVKGKVNGNFQGESNVEVELVFCGSLFSKWGHQLYDESETKGGMEEKGVILGEVWKGRVKAIYYMDGDTRIDLWQMKE